MFDVGFWELTVIAIVALLVIGPERLPAVARTVGMWLGKIRGFVSSVQTDINREIIKSEELKRLLEEQSKIKETHEILEKTLSDVRKPVSVNAPIGKQDNDENVSEKPSDNIADDSTGPESVHDKQSADFEHRSSASSEMNEPTKR